MITRFRIEGTGPSRNGLVDEILESVGVLLREHKYQDGEWECTQDVISGRDGEYKGRMVMLFHPRRESAVEKPAAT